VVELGVEHANDLAGLVADDGVLLGIVERGHRETAFVVLVDVEVDVSEMCEAFVHRIWLDVLAGLIILRSGESPALLQHLPVDRGEGDEVLQALEIAHNQGAVR